MFAGFSKNKKGIKISVSGFKDKICEFLRQLGREVNRFLDSYRNEEDVTLLQSRFLIHRQIRLKRLDALLQKTPYHLYNTVLNRVLYTNQFTINEIIDNLKTISFKQYSSNMLKLFENIQLESLYGGNLTEQESLKMSGIFVNEFKQRKWFGELNFGNTNSPRMIIPKAGRRTCFLYRLWNQNENSNLCLVSFYMLPERQRTYMTDRPISKTYSRNLSRILNAYLSSLFNEELRTRQQLGYIVRAYNEWRNTFSLFNFVVQSEKLLSAELGQRIYTFLSKQRGEFKNMTEEKFDSLKSGIIASLQQEFQSMYTQVGFMNSKVYDQTFEFQDREQSVQELRQFTFYQFLEYVERVFFEEQRVLELHMCSRKVFAQNKEVLEGHVLVEKEFGMLPCDVYENVYSLKRDHDLCVDTSRKQKVAVADHST